MSEIARPDLMRLYHSACAPSLPSWEPHALGPTTASDCNFLIASLLYGAGDSARNKKNIRISPNNLHKNMLETLRRVRSCALFLNVVMLSNEILYMTYHTYRDNHRGLPSWTCWRMLKPHPEPCMRFMYLRSPAATLLQHWALQTHSYAHVCLLLTYHIPSVA